MSIVRASLRRLHSPDIPDLESYHPESNSFGFLLQAMFGPENGDGEESFDMIVCTPGWVVRELAQKEIIVGHQHLILNEYDITKIRSFLVEYGCRCVGSTWQEVAAKLSRIGRWEFEDYAP